VNKPFLPTMPPLLLGKTGLDTDEFAALLGVPWEAFSTVKRARRLTVAEQRRFTDLRDRLEHGELAEMKSSARRPILLSEIVGEITRAQPQPQPPPKQLPLQPPKQPPNPSPGQRAVMLRKFLNIKWATLAEVTGIPVDALRTASARTQLNEASAARLTALADLTVTHPKANEFRAALAELPEPKPVTQPVPAYVPIVRKHGPNSPAATLEEMAQRYGVEVRAATQWMRVHGGTGCPRRPRAGHLNLLDALGDGAAAEIDSATVHLPLEMLDALDDAVEIGGAIVFTREALLARGWKRGLIKQMLGAPHVVLDHPMSAAPPKDAWFLSWVWAMEADPVVAEVIVGVLAVRARRERRLQRRRG